jgi:hypothetical protein
VRQGDNCAQEQQGQHQVLQEEHAELKRFAHDNLRGGLALPRRGTFTI